MKFTLFTILGFGFLSLSTASPAASSTNSGMAAVYTSCSKPNVVALTFDDGPYKWHEEVSKLLLQYGAKGTFFVNGNNWDCIYEDTVAKQLLQSYKDGHQIASHTWSHPHLTQLSDDDITSELSQIDTALMNILGIKAAFLRPPYGEYNDNVQRIAGQNGQSLVNWDFDSLDSEGATAAQSEKDYDDLFSSKPSNILALNHETYDPTVHEILPYVLKKYSSSGYQFVTVAECLGMDPYISEGSPSSDHSGTC